MAKETFVKTNAETIQEMRIAARERAEAEHAEILTLRRELAKEQRAKRNARNEKLADFYYKIAILLITGSVISCLTTFVKDANALINWQAIVIGLTAAILFAIAANCILIKNEHLKEK